ncbi:MAG: hypothetical protein L6R35_007239, partial [Caloplaca aegaea]
GDGVREENRMINVEQALEKIIGQLDSMVEELEKDFLGTDSAVEETIQLTEVLAGVPEKVEAEIVLLRCRQYTMRFLR